MAWSCRPPGALNVWIEAGNSDWQGNFGANYLLIQLESVVGVNRKIVELYEDYNFVNWLMD
jgi:hypothetical protein